MWNARSIAASRSRSRSASTRCRTADRPWPAKRSRGDGELAQAVARSGYDVTAIDPEAPAGALLQRISLEDFTPEDKFDAVVASVSLQHVEALGSAFDKIERLLHAGGVLVLEEFAKERLTRATARWY